MYFAVGAQLHEGLGDLSGAEGLLRKSINRDRNNYAALVGLGRILRKQGRTEAAASHLAHLLRSRPGDPEVALALSLTLRDMSRLEEAVNTLAGVARTSRDPRVLYNYANLLVDANKVDDAIRILEKACRIHSRNPAIWNSLGAALLKAGRLADAQDALVKAIGLDPNGLAAYNNLGHVLLELREFEQAKATLAKSLKLDAAQPAIWNSLANTYRELLDFDDAMAILERVLRDYPDHPSAYLNLAALQEERNALPQAIQVIERAVENGVVSVELELMRARLLRRQKDYSAAISLLESIDTCASHEAVKRHYELARCFDASGLYKAAWNSAKQRHESLRPLLPEETRSQILDRYARFGLQRLQGAGRESAENAPIFLVGFPRSGTTLLGRILGAHPDVTEMEEEPLLERIADEAPSWPEEPLPSDRVAALRARYRDMACVNGVILDRMPINIIHVPLIRTLWPDARIIVLVRHPVDVCVSCVFQEFDVNWLTRHLSSFADASEIFVKTMGLWMQWKNSVDAIEISYERLVAHPKDAVSDLMNRLGLRPVNASQLILDRLAAPAAKTASYSQVNERIHQHSVRRFEHYLPFMDPKTVEPLFQMAVALGYPHENRKLSAS